MSIKNLQMSDYALLEEVKRQWNAVRGQYSSGPTPFDEPMFKALISGIATAINTMVRNADALPFLAPDHQLAHMSIFHPSKGWIPLCEASGDSHGVCLQCAAKAKVQ